MILSSLEATRVEILKLALSENRNSDEELFLPLNLELEERLLNLYQSYNISKYRKIYDYLYDWYCFKKTISNLPRRIFYEILPKTK